jgi:hypothetical protein
MGGRSLIGLIRVMSFMNVPNTEKKDLKPCTTFFWQSLLVIFNVTLETE